MHVVLLVIRFCSGMQLSMTDYGLFKHTLDPRASRRECDTLRSWFIFFQEINVNPKKVKTKNILPFLVYNRTPNVVKQLLIKPYIRTVMMIQLLYRAKHLRKLWLELSSLLEPVKSQCHTGLAATRLSCLILLWHWD